MAIKKNLLWDTSDANNNGELVNTNKYYSNQDFVYGNDLNLLLAPLTHALQYYPLYDTELLNDKPQRLTYNDYLLAAYNNETIPTMFRLSYQDTNNTYSGDVNIVFDNQTASNHYTNLIIDGDFKGKKAILSGDVISSVGSLKQFYDTTNLQYSYDNVDDLYNYARNILVTSGDEPADYSQSYTSLFNHLKLYDIYEYEEEGSYTTEGKCLNVKGINFNDGDTTYLKPGTMATQSDLNALKPVSSGWRNITDPNENPFAFNNTKAPVKGVYLIEVRDDDQTGEKLDDGYAHASVVVSIDTENDVRWKRSTFGDDSVVIGIGSYTNTLERYSTTSGGYVDGITYTYAGYDAVAFFKYDDSVGGKGYYLFIDGANRNAQGSTKVLKFNRFKVTKLFDL